MARGRDAMARDPHRRFAEWLETNSDEDPPRDLAVHAAVCPGCQRQIAAIDMLTEVDTTLAGIPQVQPPSAGRLAGDGRPCRDRGGRRGRADGGRHRQLAADPGLDLGARDRRSSPRPRPSWPAPAHPSRLPAPALRHRLTRTDGDVTPSASAPTPQPPVVAPPATVGPLPPVQPTAQPTRVPRPRRGPHGRLRPTAVPTPIPTLVPTPIPTAVPTPEPTPQRLALAQGYLSRTSPSLSAACAAASRATGTRNGEQET